MRTEALNLIALGMLCFAALGACGGDKTVTDKEHGFEITYPEKWTVDEKFTVYSAVSGTSPKANGAKEVLNAWVKVFEVHEGTVLEKFVDRVLLPDNEKTAKGFKLLDRGEVKLGSTAAYRVNYVREDERTKTRIQELTYFVMSGKRGYFLWIDTTEEDFGKYAKDIDAIVKSFKLIETK